MTEEDYFVRTTIPVPNIDWLSVWGDTSPCGITTHRWKPINELNNIWPADLHDKFNSIGLKPLMARVFKWHSKSFHPWHIDGYEKRATSSFVANGSAIWGYNLTAKVAGF